VGLENIAPVIYDSVAGLPAQADAAYNPSTIGVAGNVTT
jgi:hypothetical protein